MSHARNRFGADYRLVADGKAVGVPGWASHAWWPSSARECLRREVISRKRKWKLPILKTSSRMDAAAVGDLMALQTPSPVGR